MSTVSSPPSCVQTDVGSFPRASVLSLSITLASYRQILEAILEAARRGDSRTACFANVHMTVEAAGDADFAALVNGADWVVTDGVPLTWALRSLRNIRQERVTGLDVLPDILQRAATEEIPVFFYGSTPEVLSRTVMVCGQRYPKLRIAGTFSPPFRPLTQTEELQVVWQINQSGARLVLVALGCPLQERWMARMKGQVQAVMLGIGGALPVLAGVHSRAPKWMQKAGLEWFYRLILEPRRLLRRYAYTNTLFLSSLIGQAFTRDRERFRI